MTDENHTPGPWSLDPPWSGFSAIRGPARELVFGLAAGGEDERQPDHIIDANAKLIVSAPDMAAEIERLNIQLAEAQGELAVVKAAMQYEQHRAGRIGTPVPGGETWGPAHAEHGGEMTQPPEIEK